MMSRDLKFFLTVLAYCLILYSLNWTYKISSHNVAEGFKSSSGYPAIGIALLISVVVLITLIRSTWSTLRMLLNDGAVIPKSKKLRGKLSHIILLIPLMFHSSITYVDILDDGTEITKIFSYGGELSAAIIIFSILSIILFQIQVNLNFYNWQYKKDHS